MMRRSFHRAPEAERRRDLIEATLDCIAESGLQGATVREIAIRAAGAHMVPVPLLPANRFHMRADDLEKAVTPECRALLINTPHNPTGAVLTAAEIAMIGEVCRRHDLWIVCDEVYEELVFAGGFASPFDDPALAERTVVVSSISKSHAAPGFRAGWAVGRRNSRNGCCRFPRRCCSAANRSSPTCWRWRCRGSSARRPPWVACYKARARRIVEGLKGASGVAPLVPEAGMFILLDVSQTGMTGEEFAWDLLHEEGVAVMPGSSFGDQAAGLVRLSLTTPDDVLDEACRRICALAGRAALGKERPA